MRKKSGDLNETEKALVTTTDTVAKEGNTYMGTKPNVVKETITPPISKKILTHSTKHRNHKNLIKQ